MLRKGGKVIDGGFYSQKGYLLMKTENGMIMKRLNGLAATIH